MPRRQVSGARRAVVRESGARFRRPRRPGKDSRSRRCASRTSASCRRITRCCRRTRRTRVSRTSSSRRRASSGGVAQFAGGVPAMCDGITQGNAGMELSLFSREVIAMSTAVALTHNMFDAALCLGICDKIVPGSADRRVAVRPFADHFRARRPDDERPHQRRQSQGPPAIRDRPVRSRRVARSRIGGVSRPRHLHVLRHGEQQSDADGSDGPASAELGVRAPAHAVARRAHGRSREARARTDARTRQLHADRPCRR